MIANSPPSTTNHAQPEPKRPAAAFANSSLKASKLPNLASIAEANSPVGVEDPPELGFPRIMSGLHVHHHYYVRLFVCQQVVQRYLR